MSVEIFQIPFQLKSYETFLSYDDRLNHVIIKNDSGGFGYVYLDDPKYERHNFSSDKQIRDAKFSPNLKFSAIQFSDLEIEIISFESGNRYVQSCKYKSSKGTMIIGYFWSHNENLLLVTNCSIELYQVSSDGICKLVKETKMKITNYVYSSKFGVLFLYSGSGNTIQPYIFRQNSFDKIPKFTIDQSQSTTSLNMKNLFASKIHDKVYCIFGDDTSIHLYELNLETVYKVKTIKFLLAGPNSIHFVDNLIIVHSELKISIVYDLKMLQIDEKENKKSDGFPISANPMSLKLFDPNLNNCTSKATITNSNSKTEYDNDQQLQHNQERKLSQINNLYKPSWVYINPNYIYDSSNGNWFEVTLNYENVSNFIQFDSHKIIPFLQDRTLSSAKDALLELIKTIIEFKTDSLEGIGKIFDELNRVLFNTTNRNNTELLQRQILSNSNGGLNNNTNNNNNQNNNNNSSSPYANEKKQLSSSTNSSPSIGSNRVLKPTTTSTTKSTIEDDQDTFSLIGPTNNLNLNGSSNNIPNGINNFTPIKNKLNTPPQSPNGTNPPTTATTTTAGGPMVMKSSNIKSRQTKYILIDSDDMYDKVFFQIYESKIIIETDKLKLEETTASPSATYDPIMKKKKLQQITLDSKYLIAIVTEYIRSLNFNYCRISDKLYDLLISLFIDNNMFSQLHQFLQYHVITDSLNIAYKLLSIGEQYPPVLQLSLDMFKRLMKPNIIITTLLEKGQVLTAIRLLRNIRETNPKLYQELLFPISPASFLEESTHQQNDTLFYFVFKYFESNNQHQSVQASAMDKYLQLFVEKFGEKSLSPFYQQQLNIRYPGASGSLGNSSGSFINTSNNNTMTYNSSLSNSSNSSLNLSGSTNNSPKLVSSPY
ncbi:hypothetical protein CYY_008183 [Polysphondylium violaceum]|uniref:Mic1 domain-containing protein n=1 Tax=Polysphondylium violaceum TaxID=133409 RepID=A0A8J4UX60_9MYCE|nr:hypothetical protein CYY_008183 [Polysphondylium violaceum]